MPTDTPETNGARRINHFDQSLPRYIVDVEVAEKLERQRNEYKAKLSKTPATSSEFLRRTFLSCHLRNQTPPTKIMSELPQNEKERQPQVGSDMLVMRHDCWSAHQWKRTESHRVRSTSGWPGRPGTVEYIDYKCRICGQPYAEISPYSFVPDSSHNSLLSPPSENYP